MARFSSSALLSSTSEMGSDNQVTQSGIYSIFILRESGCPFFYRIYNSKCEEPDPAILGGFFTALSLFAKEISAGQIETVITNPYQFTFHPIENGLLVLCSDKNLNPSTLDRIIKQVASLFLTKYRNHLTRPMPASESAPELEALIDQIFTETLSKSLCNPNV